MAPRAAAARGRLRGRRSAAARNSKRILSDPAILLTGFVDDSAPFYADFDVVALPCYREGFPLVTLEAAAAARAIVAADCTGMSDAVADGKTSLLVPVADSQALADALIKLLESPETSVRMGQAARGRVLRQFQPDLRSLDDVWPISEQRSPAVR